jgi:hypothetical protein
VPAAARRGCIDAVDAAAAPKQYDNLGFIRRSRPGHQPFMRAAEG